MPGNACAILRKSVLTLWPSFALVSMNMRLFLRASSSPCCVVTSRLSLRSVLLPTSTMMTSFPRSALTSSIHFLVFWKDFASVRLVSECSRRPFFFFLFFFFFFQVR